MTGTEFNIKSFAEDSIVEVALKEGSIELLEGKNTISNLKPSNIARLNKFSGKLDIQKTDLDILTAWKMDELVFDNTPFFEIIKYLERYYGVDIEIDPELEYRHNLTFKIKTETLRETLRLLSLLTPVDYEVCGKNVKIRQRRLS